jgi:hypothetical protein
MKKMEAKELRIGNIVKYENTVYLHGGKITEVDNIIQGETDYYEPIPLTEDWLLKFGFEKTSLHYFRKAGVLIQAEDNCYECYLGSVVAKLEYVHQLQNLYFALTGTELEYNEKK